ncbi:MAG: Phycocyanobilin lyase subunit alpha [Chroococcopsis gigantea SAG 12.99]|jgi:phycocyanobilin lyase alpha subunit|nr:HEAT repeat domain-containing protein [Chlorogloea purpurea SAG 13.99]MDV3000300.1 Phycocyanobilin lyase subunit alpha [Chroococcopsis gigantea SAG 12.99]
MAGVEQQAAQQITKEQAIANLQQTTDLGARYYAAWWLGKFRVADKEAISALTAALKDEIDRTPDGGYPLRRNAATALGKLGDRAAVTPLIDCLECEDYYVRESAAQALEMLRDERAIPRLMSGLEGGVEAAIPVPGKPYLQQPYEAIIEALGTLGAKDAIGLIEPFLSHPTEKVRYAAARAMYQLTKEPKYADVLVSALGGKELQLRRSALMDLGAIDYLGAAEAIAGTFAENSLKLVALKGLLENHLQHQDPGEETWRVLSLMDDLL